MCSPEQGPSELCFSYNQGCLCTRPGIFFIKFSALNTIRRTSALKVIFMFTAAGGMITGFNLYSIIALDMYSH